MGSAAIFICGGGKSLVMRVYHENTSQAPAVSRDKACLVATASTVAARRRSHSAIFMRGGGGMPEAIQRFIDTNSLDAVFDVYASIIETYKDDFAKYATQSEGEYSSLSSWIVA